MSIPLDQEIRILRSLFWSDRDPDGRAFVPLVDAYRRAGDFRQAIELLSQGLERHPDFASAHAAAARLYLEKGLVEEAEIAARKVLKLDKDNVMGLEFLADALEERGAPDEAAELRARLLELTGPGKVGGGGSAGEAEPEEEIFEIGALAPDAEEPEAAEEEVFEIGALAPDAEEPEAAEEEIFEIGALAPDAEEPEAAEEEVFQIGALAPDAEAEEAEALEEEVFEMAALAPDAEAEEAEAVEEEVFEIAALAPETDLPSDEVPLVTRTMAELYARQGLTDRALDVFRQLLEATPGDPGLRRRIAEIEAAAAEEELPGTSEPEAAGLDEYVRGHAWDAAAQRELHEVDTPFAWTEEDPDDVPEPGPSIGRYFERLLGWSPSGGETEPGPQV
jgi:tetratricopeptide (TPR) repeat protein